MFLSYYDNICDEPTFINIDAITVLYKSENFHNTLGVSDFYTYYIRISFIGGLDKVLEFQTKKERDEFFNKIVQNKGN